METWHVYQLRSDTELLYVGHTRQPGTRFNEHRRKKPWWPEVTEIQSEEFATEDEARQREKAIWAAGRPRYNKLSPFRTREELLRDALERTRRWKHAPENREHDRTRHREYQRQRYNTDTEYRKQARTASREWQRKNAGRPRRWQQDGPGLF